MTSFNELTVKTDRHYSTQRLIQFWDRLGTKQRTVFHEANVTRDIDFISFVRSDDNIFFIVEADGEPAAMMWLNGWEHYTARAHYAIFRKFYGRSVEICQEALRVIFSMTRSDGTPLVKTMIGLTPVSNRLAVKMIEKVGFKPIVCLPDTCWIADSGESVGGILSYCYYKDWI